MRGVGAGTQLINKILINLVLYLDPIFSPMMKLYFYIKLLIRSNVRDGQTALLFRVHDYPSSEVDIHSVWKGKPKSFC